MRGALARFRERVATVGMTTAKAELWQRYCHRAAVRDAERIAWTRRAMGHRRWIGRVTDAE